MPYRFLQSGSINHVYNRGVLKSKIFRHNGDYLFFIHKLSCLKKKHNLQIVTYCLMPNHFHLLLKDRQKRTSAFMKGLQLAYAKFYNHKYKQDGHLFQGPYQNRQISSRASFLRVKKYIETNPLKDGLVKDIAKWPFSQLTLPI